MSKLNLVFSTWPAVAAVSIPLRTSQLIVTLGEPENDFQAEKVHSCKRNAHLASLCFSHLSVGLRHLNGTKGQ